MRSAIAALAACFLGAAAWAQGFATKDLQTLSVDPGGFAGGEFAAQATEPGRLTVFCAECEQFTAIDILLGRSEDGTEERYRSGETTIERMEALCQARAPSCRLSATESGPAVGWMSAYQAGGAFGSTVVLFRDGDLLTIRSIAGDPETASANAKHALDTVAPMIVGGP